MKTIFLNFTGVYEKEGLSRYGSIIDLSDIEGTGMYVDDAAEAEIKRRLDPVMKPSDGVRPFLRFLDNGNHHYMSRILASYEEQPFVLITFDHHTDEQEPAFAGLKSCGSWRLDIKEENKNLRESYLIQTRENLDALMQGGPTEDLPIYISIDKDILSEEVLKTNWDQGDLEAEELITAIEAFIATGRVIAIDICGEDLPDMPYADNRDFNEMLIRRIK